MNGERLLKFLISFLVIGQVLGFVLENIFFTTCSNTVLIVLLLILYLINTKKIRVFHVTVLLVLFFGESFEFFVTENVIKYKILARIGVFILIFYFLYYNHKSFVYNSRDIFTLVLGTLLYTVIFFMAYSVLREGMKDLHLLGFLHLLLLYILLVVGAMHYINIRSEKSLWFFLSMLNFSFGDYMWLIDKFYLDSYELKVLMLICHPLAMIFLVNYMVTKPIKLRSDEFEGF